MADGVGTGNDRVVRELPDPKVEGIGSGAQNSSINLVGTVCRQNGQTYRIVAVTDADKEFIPPAGISPEDEMKLVVMQRHAERARELISEIGFRLFDPQDGKTIEGVSRLAKSIHIFSPKDQTTLGQFILMQNHNGATLHSKLGGVLVPPFSRARFEGLINELSPDVSSDFDWEGWLDHVFDPLPLNTQGVYLFKSQQDVERFHKGLRASSAEYGMWCDTVTDLFNRAVEQGDLTANEWSQYHELSQKIGEVQVKKINSVLENDEAAQGLSTRVKFSIDEDGNFSWDTVHYLDEFSGAWEKIAEACDEAASHAPSFASELVGVIHATNEWMRTSDRDLDWGRTNSTWVAASDPSNALDWLITCEEVHTHIGQKGFPQIAIAQHHADVPAQLVETLKLLFEKAKEMNVIPVLLRTLIVGGSNEHGVLLGENLPDEGSPRKSMTFMNTCGSVLIAPNFEQIAACLGREVKDIEKFKDLGGLQVAFHEYGHNLGGLAKHLQQHSSPTEEVNAQASAVYLAARYMEDATDIMEIAALWTPIRRAFQGPTEQHSKSDIYLIGKYLESGAVELRTEGSKSYLHLANAGLLAQIAFDEAIKMRLWEAGIPSELHREFQVALEYNPGEEQDFRIKASVQSYLEKHEDRIQEWQQKCFEEAEAAFKSEEMNRIALILKPVMDCCPTEQILSFFPARPEIKALLGAAA